MSRTVSRQVVIWAVMAFIIYELWSGLNKHELSDSEILVTEGSETYWSINLTPGHQSYSWGDGISNIESGLQTAAPPGQPQPPPPPYRDSYSTEERIEIEGELRALSWHSLWPVFSKTTLHIEYRLYGQQYQFSYAKPYPPEVQKLFRSLNINAGWSDLRQ